MLNCATDHLASIILPHLGRALEVEGGQDLLLTEVVLTQTTPRLVLPSSFLTPLGFSGEMMPAVSPETGSPGLP